MLTDVDVLHLCVHDVAQDEVSSCLVVIMEVKEMEALAEEVKPSTMWEKTLEKAMECLWNWKTGTRFQWGSKKQVWH